MIIRVHAHACTQHMHTTHARTHAHTHTPIPVNNPPAIEIARVDTSRTNWKPAWAPADLPSPGSIPRTVRLAELESCEKSSGALAGKTRNRLWGGGRGVGQREEERKEMLKKNFSVIVCEIEYVTYKHDEERFLNEEGINTTVN